MERNNKRLIEKLLNEFNKNDIWSVHCDVFMIRLVDNWNVQILPHAWSGLVSQRSFWFQCCITKEKNIEEKGKKEKGGGRPNVSLLTSGEISKKAAV